MLPDGRELARERFQTQFELISRYVDILTSRGIERGLLGPREFDRVWERHILNSVAIADLVPRGAEVLDVGSGAGLPGLPLAISRDDLTVTLLEPLLRRSAFLVETVDELGLAARVQVVRARAEDHRRRYGVVTARAVAPLPRLLTWLAPVRCPTGIILAVKGAGAAEELAASAEVLARLGLTAELRTLRAVPEAEPATVVRIKSA